MTRQVDAHKIEVRPCGEHHWRLNVGDDAGAAEPIFFRSGARAEAAGRSLAAKLRQAGAAAEMKIVLRDGSVLGDLGVRRA